MTSDTTRPLILVVDDDDDIRETLQLVLELEGYDVAGAANGVEALDALRGGPRPAMILLDLMMPFMNGWQFREALSRWPAMAGIPIVVTSGDGTLEKKAADLHTAGHLKKPFDVPALLDVTRRFSVAPPP